MATQLCEQASKKPANQWQWEATFQLPKQQKAYSSEHISENQPIVNSLSTKIIRLLQLMSTQSHLWKSANPWTPPFTKYYIRSAKRLCQTSIVLRHIEKNKNLFLFHFLNDGFFLWHWAPICLTKREAKT